MKKILTILLALLMVLALAGCAKKEEKKEETPVVETVTAKGVYYVTNNCGKNVGGVYLYEAGAADKGTNYVIKAQEAGQTHYPYISQFHAITIDASMDAKFAEWTGAKDQLAHFVFEFTDTDGNTIGKFDNLALEEASIVLISEDMRTGATQIAYAPRDYSEYTMNVHFWNKTGATVTGLKAVNTTTNEEIDILAELGITEIANDNAEAVEWFHTEGYKEANDYHWNIVWTYGDGQQLSLVSEGYAAHALSFENTNMQLFAAADVASGATTVSWFAPAK